MRNIPALDGYRGLAILLVMLFHAGWLHYGWAGVQLFFILSSFLVTSILRMQRERTVSDCFFGFWWRRAQRLLPLYYAYLLIVGLFVLPDGFVQHLLGLATFTFNFSQINFYPHTGTPEYNHFWTLAVEAQFYLLWPVFVRFTDDRGLRRLALAMIVVAPAMRFAGDFALAKFAAAIGSPTAPVFFLPFSHLDAFGWGALLALPRVRDPISWFIGIGAGAVSLACAPFTGRAIWTFTIATIGGAMLFRAALSQRFSKFFCPAWLQFTGRISYGLYVWHYGLMGWMAWAWPCPQHSLSSALRAAAAFAASYLIASASFFLWEQRFLRGGHWSASIFRRRPSVLPAEPLNKLSE